MRIQLTNISKRYGHSWVLRDVSHTFETGQPCAVTGPNGSGKSTLLKIVSGGLVPSGGGLRFFEADGRELHWSDAATMTAFAAPYVDLIERLTLAEHLAFHFRSRPITSGIDEAALLEGIDMAAHIHKQICDFSSGMKQRLKLALAFYTDSPVLLLDEPTSNLDAAWTNWYLERVEAAARGRLVVIASNDPREYAVCTDELRVKA